MTYDTALRTDADLATAVAEEYGALADLLEASDAAVWDAPSLCEGWRTREVVAHMTMPARYAGPAFMAELEAAGGDFTRLSNTVAARDGALPVAALLADLRSEVLHAWQPPGGGMDGALTHCVIHGLDITEAVPLARRVPDERIARVLGIVAGAGRAEPLRRRPLRGGAAGRRSRLVLRLGRGGDRAGAGAGPRGVRPPAAAGPAGRRGGGPLHLGLDGRLPARRRSRTRADQRGRGHHTSRSGPPDTTRLRHPPRALKHRAAAPTRRSSACPRGRRLPPRRNRRQGVVVAVGSVSPLPRRSWRSRVRRHRARPTTIASPDWPAAPCSQWIALCLGASLHAVGGASFTPHRRADAGR